MPDYPSLPRPGTPQYGGLWRSPPQWPCLQRRMTVGVVPFRNLTGEAKQQSLAECLTDRLVNDLFRFCRCVSFAWAADEPCRATNLATPNPSGLKYVVTGSILQSNPGMLRVNIRICDGVTAEYLWAGRHESRRDNLVSIHEEIAQKISREIKVLLLEAASRDAIIGLGGDPDVDEAFSSAAILLRGEYRAELTAEAQRRFLAALANNPHNSGALSGLALTCQIIVSSPCWADAGTVAAAFDLGSEAVALALELEPGSALAKGTQGMLYSVAGNLEQAAAAFRRAITLDPELALAHAWDGYNMAFLGHAEATLPAIERAIRLDPSDRRRSISFFFGGFAELLLGRTEAAIALLNRSLQHNPAYAPAQFFLMAALLATGRRSAADLMQESLRQHYPEYSVKAFERVWLSRSASPIYRAQVYPLFQNIWALGAA
jgi:TolB-like protein